MRSRYRNWDLLARTRTFSTFGLDENGTHVSPTVTTQQGFAPYSDRAFMVDTDVPGFSADQRAGIFRFNPMIRATGSYTYNDPTGYVHCIRDKSTGKVVHGYGADGDTNGLVSTPLLDQIHAWAQDKSKNGWFGTFRYQDAHALGASQITSVIAAASSADWQGLVTLAEANKTLRMLESAVRRLKALKPWGLALKNGEFSAYSIAQLRLLSKSKLDIERSSANAWLEYRYGWRPLVYEVQSAVKALGSLTTEKRRLVRRTTHSYSAVPTTYTGTVHTWDGVSLTVRSGSHLIQRVTGISSGIITSPRAELTPLLNTGALQLGSTAYELLPLSFVLDWFLNISDVIGALETELLVDIEGVWSTYRSSLVSDNSYYGGPSNVLIPSNKSWFASSLWSKTQRVTETVQLVERQSSPSTSGLISPSVKIRLNQSRLADLLALLHAEALPLQRRFTRWGGSLRI